MEKVIDYKDILFKFANRYINGGLLDDKEIKLYYKISEWSDHEIKQDKKLKGVKSNEN